RVRPLAIATMRRGEEIPDVPTMAEAGLPGFEASLWFAVVAPAALPTPILTRLNREINAILSDAEVRKGLANQAIQVETAGPDQLRQIIRDDIEKWRAIAQKVGIKPE